MLIAGTSATTNHSANATITIVDPVPNNSYTYHFDGSWKEQWKDGIGFILTKGSILVAYHSAGTEASSPIQAEAEVFRTAIDYVIRHNLSPCKFLTDSQIIAHHWTQL